MTGLDFGISPVVAEVVSAQLPGAWFPGGACFASNLVGAALKPGSRGQCQPRLRRGALKPECIRVGGIGGNRNQDMIVPPPGADDNRAFPEVELVFESVRLMRGAKCLDFHYMNSYFWSNESSR